MDHWKDCDDCAFVFPEEAGKLRGEEDDQSERRHEEKQRVRGPEGQRPLIPNKVSVLHVKQNGKKNLQLTLMQWTHNRMLRSSLSPVSTSR